MIKYPSICRLSNVVHDWLEIPSARCTYTLTNGDADVEVNTSCTCLVQRRPVIMKYCFALWDCARILAAANAAPADPQLIHFVSLQCLVEEIAEAFGYVNEESRRSLSISSLENIEFRVNAFRTRLEQIRVSIPLGTPISSTLILTCNSVAVYLYEVALHIPAVSKSGSLAEHNTAINPQALSTLSNLLWECLDGKRRSWDTPP